MEGANQSTKLVGTRKKILGNFVYKKLNRSWGSGCSSVGSVFASITIGPRFKSIHRQNLILNIFTVNC